MIDKSRVPLYDIFFFIFMENFSSYNSLQYFINVIESNTIKLRTVGYFKKLTESQFVFLVEEEILQILFSYGHDAFIENFFQIDNNC